MNRRAIARVTAQERGVRAMQGGYHARALLLRQHVAGEDRRGRVRHGIVNVQHIQAQTDSHLWAEIYDRKLTDIFAVESDVAKAIAEQLRAKLTGQEARVVAAKPTISPHFRS